MAGAGFGLSPKGRANYDLGKTLASHESRQRKEIREDNSGIKVHFYILYKLYVHFIYGYINISYIYGYINIS